MLGIGVVMEQNRIFKFLASLKLAVLLLVALAIILAVATFYESIYDAKTAQHLVYRSNFFAAFLFLLGVNVFCAAASRYPWKKHQLGFVLTHLGIILILIGSLVTQFFGVDGSLAVQEGSSGSRVAIDEPILYLGKGKEKIAEVSAEFRWNPPREGNEYRYPLGEGVSAVVDRYYHHALEDISYEESEGRGIPAVKLRLHNTQVDVSEWFTATGGPVTMGPATIELIRLGSEEALDRFLAGKQESDRGELHLLVQGSPHRIPVSGLSSEPQPVDDTGYHVRLLNYFPHAVVEDGKLISRSQEPVNPALEIQLMDSKGNSQVWLLFARLPDLNTPTGGSGEVLPIRALFTAGEAAEGGRRLTLGVGPDATLYYQKDNGEAGPLSLGEDIFAGWIDLKFQAEQYVQRGRRVRNFREFQPKKTSKREGPPPAIRIQLEGSPEAGPHWLGQGDVVRVPPAQGQEPLVVGYGLRTVETEVQVHLKDFQIGFDPGTASPASYKSLVEVDGQEHTVQMNEPLVKNGYTFFQSSYSEVNGEPVVSVFSVAKDPGIGLKYTGSIILVLGIIIMFYLKPHMVKNRSRKRRREPGRDFEEEGETR